MEDLSEVRWKLESQIIYKWRTSPRSFGKHQQGKASSSLEITPILAT